MRLIIFMSVVISWSQCETFKILFLLPYNGTSHHLYYSTLIEKLANRNHQITVVNYLTMNNSTNIRHISLQEKVTIQKNKRKVVIERYYEQFPNYLSDVMLLMENVRAQQEMARINCENIFKNKEVLDLMKRREMFDVFVMEQFYSDCGLAWANKLGVPSVGITAHIMMPWTYPRVGAPFNPAFVPSRVGKRGLLARVKAIFLNAYSNFLYRFKIQATDQAIAKRVFPDTPDLEDIAKNMSMVLVNQYYPLTGSRIYGANVVEIGGMHIKQQRISDDTTLHFVENAKHGVVYISFGSVACGLPQQKMEAIVNVISKSKMNFLWKTEDIVNMTLPQNLMTKSWFSQVDLLCHPNIKAFITHAGMLSSIEAMHCGVPVVSVPIFGDQFANAQSMNENGLGVTVNLMDLDEDTFGSALDEILQEKFQSRAKYLSTIWRDRPVHPLDTATHWIEFVARNRGFNLQPPTVHLPLYQYLMLDVYLIVGTILFLILYINVKIWLFFLSYSEIYWKRVKKVN